MDRALCRRVRRSLGALADRAPDPGERHLLEAHLGECPACTDLVNRARRIARLLSSLPVAQAPAELDGMIWDRLLAEDRASGFTAGLSREMTRLPRADVGDRALRITVAEEGPVADLLASQPRPVVPAELDVAVQRELRRFLWSRSRESRLLRWTVGTLAAAASLALCLGLWTGVEKAPRLQAAPVVYHEVSRPPAGWWTHEAQQSRIHGLLPDEDTSRGRSGAGRADK